MRRKGADVHGWVILDKPAGMGSTQAVALVRRALGARKAGHAGTLDPDATGILAVALGEATKTVPVLEAALKTYDFAVVWGAETATDDASGAVIATSDARPSAEAVAAALGAFRGDIVQVPPQVSAVKVAGERAYDLARAGVAMDLAARPLRVEALELLDAGPDGATLRMTCGKGGYVRSIARDLGRALGCLGHVAWLRRTASGPFTLADAVPPEAVGPEALLPLAAALAGLPRVVAEGEAEVRLRHGNPARLVAPDGPVWVASAEGAPLCLAEAVAGEVRPGRVFVL